MNLPNEFDSESDSVDLGVEERIEDAAPLSDVLLRGITIAERWVGANSAVQMGVVFADREPNGDDGLSAEMEVAD